MSIHQSIKWLTQITLILIGLAGTLVHAATIPTQASGNYAPYCQDEWSKRGVLDQRMYNFCMSKEAEGYQKLVVLVNKYRNIPWLQTAINYSVSEWTKKGSRQDSMVYFTLNKIIDGWEELNYQSKQPNFNRQRFQACEAQWGFKYDMVLFCYKNN